MKTLAMIVGLILVHMVALAFFGFLAEYLWIFFLAMIAFFCLVALYQVLTGQLKDGH